jgi:hypothetical protein
MKGYRRPGDHECASHVLYADRVGSKYSIKEIACRRVCPVPYVTISPTEGLLARGLVEHYVGGAFRILGVIVLIDRSMGCRNGNMALSVATPHSCMYTCHHRHADPLPISAFSINSAGLYGASTALHCSRPVASGRGAAPPLSPCMQWTPAPLPSADTRKTDDRRGVQAADGAAAGLTGALDERSSVRPTPCCVSAL